MKINILTIFPEMFEGWYQTGMIRQAIKTGAVELNVINIRDYTTNKHKKIDDETYGGLGGMLMQVQPLDDAILANNLEKSHIVFPSPKGEVFNQDLAKKLAQYDELTLVAGRYEGIDQRFIDMHVNQMISLGDYILTGGEVAIMSILDATIRLLPNVLNNPNSSVYESFHDDLLEYPQYTRPREYKGRSVPEVLLNGNPKKINEWCYEQQLLETKKYRPDLYLEHKSRLKQEEKPDK